MPSIPSTSDPKSAKRSDQKRDPTSNQPQSDRKKSHQPSEKESAQKPVQNPIQNSEKVQSLEERQRDAFQKRRRQRFERRWWWTFAFWLWLLGVHLVGLFYFTSGFLLTRYMLDDQSTCADPPIPPNPGAPKTNGLGVSADVGCWHPRSFSKVVILIIDALRYDFTVPAPEGTERLEFHNAFTFPYRVAVESPEQAFLRPFIADPPTTTLQRLKALTTGTLPTFIDAGRNFMGTEIEEDSLISQWKGQGKRIVQLGDDTWWSLFPDTFAEGSRAYDSFNVWDLHTVDQGVMDHIFPFFEEDKKNDWDILIGHGLGVDHAGHRYGPNHPAMKAKLGQMDSFVYDVTQKIDEDTLLVVLGDHGMDAKGDHGGESDDEVQAALWMYSRRPFFGRSKPEYARPPENATVRPIGQIDLVPTLALLTGIPIPFNSLGQPIEEAFLRPGYDAVDWSDLAQVSRLSAAGIRRYQQAYFSASDQAAAGGNHTSTTFALANRLWEEALQFDLTAAKDVAQLHAVFLRYQVETLRVCRELWAQFDVPSMIFGVGLAALSLVVLVMFSSKSEDDDFAIVENDELDLAERKLERLAMSSGSDVVDSDLSYQSLHKSLAQRAGLGMAVGGVAAVGYTVVYAGRASFPEALTHAPAGAAVGSVLAVFLGLTGAGKTLWNVRPTSYWSFLSVVVTLSMSAGFGANSYTIWEDSILLFVLSTFGISAVVASLSLASTKDRILVAYHSIVLVLLGRVASMSKLCREEQIPNCTSTYYASSTMSTSAVWQLAIPFVVMFVLPRLVQSFLTSTRSYEGFSPLWVDIVFRPGLGLSALYWVMDAAGNGHWIPQISEEFWQASSVFVAQLGLGLLMIGGTTAYIWSPPSVSITTVADETTKNRAQVQIFGYGNAHGARYLLFPLNAAAACMLLSKPMGQGALAVMLWQVLTLLEVVDLLGLGMEPIGPVMLAVLGNFHFFTTGHQAVLSTIQWDASFIALSTIQYPWTPAVMVLNTFAGQIVATLAVPLLVLWKSGPKRKGVLESVSRQLGLFVGFYAVEALATMVFAGVLRRHLMLYRVFSPRFMMAALVLLTVDVTVLVVLAATRGNIASIADLFGWAD